MGRISFDNFNEILKERINLITVTKSEASDIEATIESNLRALRDNALNRENKKETDDNTEPEE